MKVKMVVANHERGSPGQRGDWTRLLRANCALARHVRRVVFRVRVVPVREDVVRGPRSDNCAGPCERLVTKRKGGTLTRKADAVLRPWKTRLQRLSDEGDQWAAGPVPQGALG